MNDEAPTDELIARMTEQARRRAEAVPLPRLTDAERATMPPPHGGQMGSPTSAVAIEALNRKQKAVAMRLDGYDYMEIAAELQVGYETARKYVVDDLSDRRYQLMESKEDLRSIMLMRLEQMWFGVRGDATGGDPKAIHAALRIMERQAKLQGLDATTHKAMWLMHLKSGEVTQEELVSEAMRLLEEGRVQDIVDATPREA